MFVFMTNLPRDSLLATGEKNVHLVQVNYLRGWEGTGLNGWTESDMKCDKGM